MRFSKRVALFLAATLFATGCGGGGAASDGGPSQSKTNAAVGSLPALSGANVMAVTVNGALCSAGSYPNKPCVSVTVCTPGTASCQTINDILLDTGSYGLRVFSQALSVSLPQVTTSGGKAITQCVQFGDGTSDWGQVRLADVVLGGEAAVTVPIQVIDAQVPGGATNCAGADTSPAEAGFNGILGVGLFAQDCGTSCAPGTGSTSNGIYFACSGSTCTGTTVGLASQVTNPVSALSQDSNGIQVVLPQLGLGGATSVEGYLVLGIGTQDNNVPAAGVGLYAADSTYGEISSIISGKRYDSFLDTGSNGLFFSLPSTATQLPGCGTDAPGWYCPSSTRSLQAINYGTPGGTRGTVDFQVGNALWLMENGNGAYLELGGEGSGTFDWGLPFYFGRRVYLGIENKTSSLGSGPYWAF